MSPGLPRVFIVDDDISVRKMNKQVGRELGISEITVKAHRGHVMHKMAADSLADLVRMASTLGLESTTRLRPRVDPPRRRHPGR